MLVMSGVDLFLQLANHVVFFSATTLSACRSVVVVCPSAHGTSVPVELAGLSCAPTVEWHIEWSLTTRAALMVLWLQTSLISKQLLLLINTRIPTSTAQ